jgi:hypothetical protein
MSGATVTVPSVKGESTLVRATFASGMLLQHEDLEQLTTYTRELSRLLFRSLFGCGVVCGLKVETESKCGIFVIVRAGLALDCAGDPIYVPKDQRIMLDEECDPNIEGPLWVVLCGTVKRCAPRASMCGSDEDEAPLVRTREREGFEIRVVSEPPTCVCRCFTKEELVEKNYVPPDQESECRCVDPAHPCYAAHYRGECGCQCDDCNDCEGKCVVLALLEKEDTGEGDDWSADHSVRRFIRPVLMRDPLVLKVTDTSAASLTAATEQPGLVETAGVLFPQAGRSAVKAPRPRSRRKSEDEPEA